MGTAKLHGNGAGVSTAREKMLAKRAEAPRQRGYLSVRAGRSDRFTPLFYWDNGGYTLGFDTHPKDSRPYPYDAWLMLDTLAQENDGPLPGTLGDVLKLLELAHRAWLHSPEDSADAMRVLRQWLRPLPAERVKLGAITVTLFNKT